MHLCNKNKMFKQEQNIQNETGKYSNIHTLILATITKQITKLFKLHINDIFKFCYPYRILHYTLKKEYYLFFTLGINYDDI